MADRKIILMVGEPARTYEWCSVCRQWHLVYTKKEVLP